MGQLRLYCLGVATLTAACGGRVSDDGRGSCQACEDAGNGVHDAAQTFDEGGTNLDASVSDALPCQAGCSVEFASGPDWESFAGASAHDVGPAHGASLGRATEVCAGPHTPSNCPNGTSGVVIYGFQTSGWTAGNEIPRAFWIWRGDVALTGKADLEVGVFERTFVVGAQPAGTIHIGADDFAAVFVNGVAIATVGSVRDVTTASASENTGATFDLTPALRTGSNTITIVGQNGPAAFVPGGCGASGCTYAQNPAGVVFAGSLTWR